MKEIDKNVIISNVGYFINDKIKNYKIKKEFLKQILISLKNTEQNIKNDTCPFDQNLGTTLDFIVDFANKNKITSGAQKEFSRLVNSHLDNIQYLGNTDKSFMSAKKLLTHIKQLKNCIIQSGEENSSSSKSSNLFKKLKTKLKNKSEAKKNPYTTILDLYLKIVIDLLKIEKYRLTNKVEVKDSSLNYVGLVNGTNPVTEQLINSILSENFTPKESDIKQGSTINDCYLLAALKNIARENPNAIKKCFVASRNGGLIMRFYKVVAKTKKCSDNKVKLTTKAAGRVMIMMDKTVLYNYNTKGNIVLGNQQSDALSVWVNLMEKAYAIYVSKRNIIDKDLNFFQIYGCCIDNWDKGDNQLSAVEYGLSVVPTTAITGKKGTCYLIDTRNNKDTRNNNQEQTNNSNSGNLTTSQSQSGKIDPSNNSNSGNTTTQPQSGKINPYTILDIIDKALKEGKSVTAGTFQAGHDCWNTTLRLKKNDTSYEDMKYSDFQFAFCAGHSYSVKNIKEINGINYIVLSNPYMDYRGIMITGDVLTYYGNTGDVYLTPKNFSKYIRNYSINKLNRKNVDKIFTN